MIKFAIFAKKKKPLNFFYYIWSSITRLAVSVSVLLFLFIDIRKISIRSKYKGY